MAVAMKTTKGETERVRLMPGANRIPRVWQVHSKDGLLRAELQPGKTVVVPTKLADVMYHKMKLQQKPITVPDGESIEERTLAGRDQGKEREEYFDHKYPIVFLDRD